MKLTISYSELAEFLGCNHKHYLGYTKKLKTNAANIHLLFGTSMHSALELYFKKEVDRYSAISYFVAQFINTESIKKYDNAELIKFKNQGIKILTEIFQKYNWEKIEVLENELFIEENIFENYYLRGKIDFVYRYGNNIFITDFKTSTKEWDHYKYNDKYYGLQLKLYKYFYCQKYKIPLDNIRLVYIVLNRNDDNKSTKYVDVVEVKHTSQDIIDAYSLLCNSLKIIYSKENFEKYLRKTIGYNCNFCEFNGADCSGNIGSRYFKNYKKAS